MLFVFLNQLVPKNLFLFSYGSNYMIYFIIGIIGALLLKKFPETFEAFQSKCTMLQKTSNLVVLFLFITIIGFSIIYINNIINILILGLATLAIIAIFWSVSFPKIIIILGDISYSFYLIHFFIVKFCTRILMKLGLPNNIFTLFLYSIICYVITASISWVIYSLIEKKLADKLKGILLK